MPLRTKRSKMQSDKDGKPIYRDRRAKMPPKFVGARIQEPECPIINPGVEITRIPSTPHNLHDIDPDEFDPAKARFIDRIATRSR